MASFAFKSSLLLTITVSAIYAKTCPGFPGYCSEAFPGQTCVVVCSRGRNNVPLCQEDGTWTDIPRCIEHEPGQDEQIPGICPGISGYCSEGYVGQKCNFACSVGAPIDSVCTADGTWYPYPTCADDIRETQDGCNPCPGPNGRPRNRQVENVATVSRPKSIYPDPPQGRTKVPTFAGTQSFGPISSPPQQPKFASQPQTIQQPQQQLPRQQPQQHLPRQQPQQQLPRQQPQQHLPRQQPQQQLPRQQPQQQLPRQQPQQHLPRQQPQQQLPRQQPQQPASKKNSLLNSVQQQVQFAIQNPGAAFSQRQQPQQQQPAFRQPQQQPQQQPTFRQPQQQPAFRQPQQQPQQQPTFRQPQQQPAFRQPQQPQQQPSFRQTQQQPAFRQPQQQQQPRSFELGPQQNQQTVQPQRKSFQPVPPAPQPVASAPIKTKRVFNPQTGQHEEIAVNANAKTFEENFPDQARPLSEGRFIVGANGELDTLRPKNPPVATPKRKGTVAGNLPVFEAIPEVAGQSRPALAPAVAGDRYGLFEEIQL